MTKCLHMFTKCLICYMSVTRSVDCITLGNGACLHADLYSTATGHSVILQPWAQLCNCVILHTHLYHSAERDRA
jgi:hypothetical protein